MSQSLQDCVQHIFADVLSLSAEHVMPETSPERVETWDSVNHLNLVLALEQEFGLQFTPEEIEQLLSFEHVVVLLEQKLGVNESLL
jgi:acyl carrier protein